MTIESVCPQAISARKDEAFYFRTDL